MNESVAQEEEGYREFNSDGEQCDHTPREYARKGGVRTEPRDTRPVERDRGQEKNKGSGNNGLRFRTNGQGGVSGNRNRGSKMRSRSGSFAMESVSCDTGDKGNPNANELRNWNHNNDNVSDGNDNDNNNNDRNDLNKKVIQIQRITGIPIPISSPKNKPKSVEKNIFTPSDNSETMRSLEKLSIYQAKLAEVIREEKIDETTGISVDKDGNSLGYVDVVVLSARNLPEINKLSHSADPYVELLLSGGEKDDEKSENKKGIVTSVQWNNLFPVWREDFKLFPIQNLNQSIKMAIKNLSKLGEDEVIGHCELSLATLLNQKSHLLWLPINPPIDSHKLRSRIKFHENCAIKIEIKLFYCQRILLQQKFDNIVERLKYSTKRENVPESSEGGSKKGDSRRTAAGGNQSGIITQCIIHRKESLKSSIPNDSSVFSHNNNLTERFNRKNNQNDKHLEPSNLQNKDKEKIKSRIKSDIDTADMLINPENNTKFIRIIGLRDKTRPVEYKSNTYDNTNFKSSKFDGRLPHKESKKSTILSPSYLDKKITKILNFSQTAAATSITVTPTTNVAQSFDDFMNSNKSNSTDFLHRTSPFNTSPLKGLALNSPSSKDSPSPVSMGSIAPDAKKPVLSALKRPVIPVSNVLVSHPHDLSIFKSSRSRLELKSKPKKIQRI